MKLSRNAVTLAVTLAFFPWPAATAQTPPAGTEPKDGPTTPGGTQPKLGTKPPGSQTPGSKTPGTGPGAKQPKVDPTQTDPGTGAGAKPPPTGDKKPGAGAKTPPPQKGQGGDTPLVIDLNEDGLIEVQRRPVAFPFAGAGSTMAEWIGPKDGFLVRDLNGNGRIDNGSELFGSETIAPKGKRFADGFQALVTMDDNGDGIVDADDQAFSELRVWIDQNSDGESHEDEIFTLENLGLEALFTEATAPRSIVSTVSGSALKVSSAVRHGRKILVVDVLLKVNRGLATPPSN